MRTTDICFLYAQSTDSDKESTALINADTSLSTVCGKRPFLFRVKKKHLQLTACRCSQRYSTSDSMLCRLFLSNELCRERFLCLSDFWVFPWILSAEWLFLAWRLEVFNLTMLMFSFIPSVFCPYKRCLFLLDPLNTDTVYGPFDSVRINEVWLYVLKIYSDYTTPPRIKAPPFVSPLKTPYPCL